jgi:peptidoglycan/LPS O-acetylase OafA/YrhL
MLVRGNRGLLRALPVAWIGTISEGFYFLHIPGLSISDRGPAALPRIPPHGSAQVFLPLMTAISWAWVSGALFKARILRLNDRFSGTGRRRRGARDTG